MKALVIAEKPSVARDIARVLKCQKSLNGALEGDRYIVTWALGHLVTLADPEDYDKKYKEWKMEDLPMLPDTFRLEVIKQSAKQFQAVSPVKPSGCGSGSYRHGCRAGRRTGSAADLKKDRMQKAAETAVDIFGHG